MLCYITLSTFIHTYIIYVHILVFVRKYIIFEMSFKSDNVGMLPLYVHMYVYQHLHYNLR